MPRILCRTCSEKVMKEGPSGNQSFMCLIHVCFCLEGLAFARDPDGYWVEIIKRGGYDADATPYFFETG